MFVSDLFKRWFPVLVVWFGQILGGDGSGSVCNECPEGYLLFDFSLPRSRGLSSPFRTSRREILGVVDEGVKFHTVKGSRGKGRNMYMYIL